MEFMAIVPFWLKLPICFQSTAGGEYRMSAQLEVQPALAAEGDLVLLGLLLVASVGGILLGGGCGCVAVVPTGTQTPTP